MYVPAPNTPLPILSVINTILPIIALIIFASLISKLSAQTRKSFGITNLIRAGICIILGLSIRSAAVFGIIDLKAIPEIQAAMVGYTFAILVFLGSIFFALSARDLLKTLKELNVSNK